MKQKQKHLFHSEPTQITIHSFYEKDLLVFMWLLTISLDITMTQNSGLLSMTMLMQIVKSLPLKQK